MNSWKPVLLDTHYWIWMQLGMRGEFNTRVLRLVEEAAVKGALLLSTISVREFGMLEARARIRVQVPVQE